MVEHAATGRLLARRSAGSAVVLLVGAGVYALLEGVAKANFDLTPLALGLIAVAAGLFGSRGRPLATGLVLAGWGSAVLLVDHGVVPAARTTPAYMLGIGVGLMVAARLAPAGDRGAWLTSASIVAFASALILYLADGMSGVAHWQLWVVVLIAWAAWELFWSTRQGVVPAGPGDGPAPEGGPSPGTGQFSGRSVPRTR